MQFFSKIVLEIFQQKDTNKKGGIVARRGEMRMEGNMGGRWWKGMKGELLRELWENKLLIYRWLKAPFLG